MILKLRRGAPEEAILQMEQRLHTAGVRTERSLEPRRVILVTLDPVPAALSKEIASLPIVAEHHPLTHAWRQVDRAFRDTPTVVNVGPYSIGPGHPCVIMSGPCSVEGRQAVLDNARQVRAAGAHILRGGAFKPRTSPYAFQGFGVEGLRQLKDAGEATGMPVVSEIMDGSLVPAFLDHDIDIFQIGARNMQNFTLLKAVGRAHRPVLLKRGLAATVAEWLLAAEYLLASGTPHVILCERGIRTFETATRNTLDLTVLPLLRRWTHLPIVVDPAHAAGAAALIPTLCRASVAAGADGLTVECHLHPEEARSDGPQALLPGELKEVVAEARILRSLFA